MSENHDAEISIALGQVAMFLSQWLMRGENRSFDMVRIGRQEGFDVRVRIRQDHVMREVTLYHRQLWQRTPCELAHLVDCACVLVQHVEEQERAEREAHDHSGNS